MSAPTHWLGAIPTRKGICRESRVNKGKMCLVMHVIEIVEIIIDLHGCELSFIDNSSIAQRANVKPLVQPNSVRRLLAQHIELSFKILLIEVFRGGGIVTTAISGFKNDKRLEDVRFLRQGGRSEDAAVTRDLSPPENSQTEFLSNCLESCLAFCSDLRIGAEKDVANSILSRGRKLEMLLDLEFSFHECMGDGRHNPSSVTIASIRSDGTTMSHVAQQTASYRISGRCNIDEGITICNNFMADFTLDVTETC